MEEEMAKSRESVRGILEGSAHQLAFHIGQSVEQTLVARAVGFAARGGDESGEVVVTTEHIRRALDEVLIDEACARVGIFPDGKTKIRISKSQAG
jgi:hypothetical protein